MKRAGAESTYTEMDSPPGTACTARKLPGVLFLFCSPTLCSGCDDTHDLTWAFLTHQLFVDKDTIVNAVGASHDIHLLKIDNREDELVTRISSWCAHLVDKVSKCRHILAG